MYATLSIFFNFFITNSPINELLISFFPVFLTISSISSIMFFILSCEMGRFSNAFSIPLASFSLMNFSLLPSFFITYNSLCSIFSYVVNLFLHLRHSLLLLIPKGEALLSVTFDSLCAQKGQFIIFNNIQYVVCSIPLSYHRL